MLRTEHLQSRLNCAAFDAVETPLRLYLPKIISEKESLWCLSKEYLLITKDYFSLFSVTVHFLVSLFAWYGRSEFCFSSGSIIQLKIPRKHFIYQNVCAVSKEGVLCWVLLVGFVESLQKKPSLGKMGGERRVFSICYSFWNKVYLFCPYFRHLFSICDLMLWLHADIF